MNNKKVVSRMAQVIEDLRPWSELEFGFRILDLKTGAAIEH